MASGTRDGGVLPVNVRVILEGEEEVGGEGIARFVREHGDQAAGGCERWCRIRRCLRRKLPTLCVGLRGMIYTEIEVRGARRRTSTRACTAGRRRIPFVAMAQIISKLKDEGGRRS